MGMYLASPASEVPMRSSALALCLTLLSTGAFAQNPPPRSEDPQKPPAAVGEEGKKPTRNFASALVHNLGDDIKHLPRQNSVYWLAGGGAAALAIHPLDDNINRHFEGTGATDAFWKPGQVIGNTLVLLGAGGTSYIIGHAKKSDRAQHLGMDIIEAETLSVGLVYGLKEAVRRPRPDVAEVNAASGFSFPSGHAASTFAAATVLQQHLGYKAGLPTYLIASYVAMSRLHENVHNASDVVFGATVGIIVGRSVTWHGRNFYASPMLVPRGTGIIVNVDLNARPALRTP
jgi:membrane-associated phospholipid phosphatase